MFDVQFLAGEGPNKGPEHKEIASAVLRCIATVQINPLDILFVYTDEGSIIMAAPQAATMPTEMHLFSLQSWLLFVSAEHILKSLWVNAHWFLCVPHKLHGIGSLMKSDRSFEGQGWMDVVCFQKGWMFIHGFHIPLLPHSLL